MKVLLLVRSLESPSARYRILQYLPAIQSSGIETQVECLPHGWLARRCLFRRASAFDVVLLQKRLLPLHAIRILRRYAKRLIYDFDDAVLFRSPGKGGAESATRRRRFRAIVGAADVVFAGSPYLKEIAAPFAKRVVVQPTVIDPTKYNQAARVPKNSGKITIGWIGSRTTMRYLLSLRDALEHLAGRLPNLQLKIVSDAFMDLEKMPVIKKPWSEEDEAADVAGFDIGIAPSFDDPWSRGKCGFKILQYMACRLPVVCTPVGVQSDMVADGENGFWATTPEEWVDRLARLAESPEERIRMGHASRKRLGERYSLAHWAPRLTVLLAEIGAAHS